MKWLDFLDIHSKKTRCQIQITLFLLVLIFGFLFVFLPIDELVSFDFETYLQLIIKFATSATLSLIIRKLLFATDPLATGTSKYSLFFRKYYPSNLIKEKYGIPDGEAKALWFDFFNSWSNKDNRFHSQWIRVFDRTYACRFIFYFTRLLLMTAISSGAMLLIFGGIYWFFHASFEMYKGIIFFLIVTIAYLFLACNNKIPGAKRPNATGCWYKYQEISEILFAILKKQILNKCPKYEDAIRLIDSLHVK
jgi:hypothetical protein